MDKISSFEIGVIDAMEKVAISPELSRRVAKLKYNIDMPALVHRRKVVSKGSSSMMKRRSKELGQQIAAGASAQAYKAGPRIRGGDMANKQHSRVFKGGSPGLKKKK